MGHRFRRRRSDSPDAQSAPSGGGTATYVQSTGQLIIEHGGQKYVFQGGSGIRGGHNNPDAEGIKKFGPVTRGTYNIGMPHMHSYHMKDGHYDTTMSLLMSRIGRDPYGRGGFLVHHEHSRGRQSIGCVVFSDRDTRRIMELRRRGVFSKIQVVGSMGRYEPTNKGDGAERSQSPARERLRGARIDRSSDNSRRRVHNPSPGEETPQGGQDESPSSRQPSTRRAAHRHRVRRTKRNDHTHYPRHRVRFRHRRLWDFGGPPPEAFTPRYIPYY